MLDAMGDKEGFNAASLRLKQRQQTLRDFTDSTSRTNRVDRTQVAGYNRSVAGKVTQSVKRQLKAREDKIRELIKSDATPKKINVGSQNKHIRGSKGHIEGRSYIFGDMEASQTFVNRYHGTGEIKFTKSGKWANKEFITVDSDIGMRITVDGMETPTNTFVIYYGKKGTHIVPAKRR